VAFVWHCGFRPASELLFFLQQKKSNQKNAAPHHLPRKKAFGVPEFSSVANEPALMRRPGAQG